MANPSLANDELICRTAGITPQELAKARQIEAERNAPKGMMAMMMAAAAQKDQADKTKSGNGHPTSAKTETNPHGKMPESMKEAMKKWELTWTRKKQWKWLNLWEPARKH